jgi:hypothetical protein
LIPTKVKIVTTLLLTIFCNIYSHTVFIVIHGTWGSESPWYAADGDFFTSLETTAHKKKAAVVPFCWSGSNSHEARNKAAKNLSKLIESYDVRTKIILIGHSHGGTVALLASQLLSIHKISIIYTLGTPINTSIYPDMNNVGYCYNLFSFEDLVQTVLGLFRREHAAHERIRNIRVILNGIEPDHAQLHHDAMGRWIPHIHCHVMGFEHKHPDRKGGPGVIKINNTRPPKYTFDGQREELLEKDNQLSRLILNSFRKSFEMGSKTPLTNR